METRRVLITGLSTYWGGRLAQALEQSDAIEAIIGVDSEDPTRELERTEFVRVGTQHALLRRIVEAAEIDTVVDTRLVVDSAVTSARNAHENNVIGTMNILAACGAPDSTVRKLIFKSSAHYYGCEQDDPAFFTETMGRPHPPRTPIERDILDAESGVVDFAEKNPNVTCTVLRCSNVLGPDVRTSHTALFSLPLIPMILGFDPRYQFVHEDDVVAALAHAALFDTHGIFNIAGDGVLAFTEVAGLLGKQYAPILPPWGTGAALGLVRRLGLRIPPEMVRQLRFGRGIDNRKFKATGFNYHYTTRETVLKLAEHMRLHPVLRGVSEPYRYERDVEEFLRWSPHVRNAQYRSEGRLAPGELIELQRLLSSYSDRVGPVGASPMEQAEATTRAASAQPSPNAPQAEEGPNGGAPREGPRGDGPPERVVAAADQAATAEPPESPPPGHSHEPGIESGADVEEHPTGQHAPAPEREPAAVEHYDDLDPAEILGLLESLEDGDLGALKEYEERVHGRAEVLSAIEGVLVRRAAGRQG
ncbi:MAG: NAD-dependent epimerase/dehydratase family protein [Thermoleophilaceae bacterium]